jgi:hypothetical protein
MNKYLRTIRGRIGIKDRAGRLELEVDVYDVLKAFEVTCPARQHVIKKLLCSGIRGTKTAVEDLIEARMSLDRAIEMAYEESHEERK